MFQMRHQLSACALARRHCVDVGRLHRPCRPPARRSRRSRRDTAHARKVFVIAMENHNWTQPATTLSPQPIFMNPQAPFINSLVNGTSGISDAGRVRDPLHQLGRGCSSVGAQLHLGRSGHELRRVQRRHAVPRRLLAGHRPDHRSAPERLSDEGAKDLEVVSGRHRRGPRHQRRRCRERRGPFRCSTCSGVFTSGGSTPTTTRRSTTTRPSTIRWCSSPTRTAAAIRPPRIRCARSTRRCSSWRSICRTTTWPTTPGLRRTSSTTCTPGSPTGTVDRRDRPTRATVADIAQGDNFLARIVPLIMASEAYKDHGVIVLWWDESEGGDTPAFTLPFIVISKDAHQNVKGLPFASATEFSHSSTLRTHAGNLRRRPARVSPGWALRQPPTTCPRCSSRARSSSVRRLQERLQKRPRRAQERRNTLCGLGDLCGFF